MTVAKKMHYPFWPRSFDPRDPFRSSGTACQAGIIDADYVTLVKDDVTCLRCRKTLVFRYSA